MPTEHIPPAPGHTFEPSVVAPTQIKVCSVCHGPLDTAELVFTLARMGPDDVCPSPAPAPGVVCSPCADRARVQAIDRAMAEPLRIRRQSTLEPMVEEPSAESDGDSPSGGPQTPPPDVRPGRGLTPLTIPSRSPVRSPTTAFAHSSSRVAHSMAAHSAAQHPPSPPRSPPARLDPAAFGHELDPYADVTRLRLKHTRQDCLYPGASFVGIQKSGRNSYDVSVTIVNVDFPGSTLCGYLTIENLTDDHPQLTTYFDAEIIGPKYGFLTQSYGASESDDMTHWGRFDSFRSIKSEMRRPGLTIRQKSLSERGFIFMRWKERFLVPEHQVRGIRGASYDGFYYVCVQLNSQAESPLHTHSPIRETTSPIQTYHPLPVQQTTPTPTHVPAPPSPTRTRSMSSASARTIGPISPEVLQSTDEFPPLSPTQRQHQAPVSPPSPRITRSHSHSFRSNSQDTWGGGGRGASSRMPTVSATMTGFYFHQNSEPYQQLTLHYQPERNTSVFEFR